MTKKNDNEQPAVEEDEWALTVARLQRFYGGDPMQWFHPMPQLIRQGFVDALPIIMAEERLAEIYDIMVGTGSIKHKGSGQAHIRQLEGVASRGKPRRRGKAGPADLALLAIMGIGVNQHG